MEPEEVKLVLRAHEAVSDLLDGGLNRLQLALDEGLELAKRGYEAADLGLGPLQQAIFVLGLYRSALDTAGPRGDPEYAARVPGPFTWIVRQLAFDGAQMPRFHSTWSSRFGNAPAGDDVDRMAQEAISLCARLVLRFGAGLEDKAREALAGLRPPPLKD